MGFARTDLAPRTLHFTNQLYFECAAGSASETQPWGEDPKYYSEDRLREVRGPTNLDTAFGIADKYYLMAHLSFESDKVVAFGGIARFLSDRGLGLYVAGLWRVDLMDNLLWRAECPGTLPKKYRAPSWSWMAIDRPMGHIPMARYESKISIQVLEIIVQPKFDGDIFGQINFASLIIICSTLKTAPLGDLKSHKFDNSGGKEPYYFHFDYDMLEAQASQEVFLSHILTRDFEPGFMEGLLLQRSMKSSNCYERLGKFALSPSTPWSSSSIWPTLEDAEMHQREIGCVTESGEERFIITLV